MVNYFGTVAWALAHWNSSPGFPNSVWYGDDCTDFASSALHFGGRDPETWPTSGGNPINERSNDWYWYNGSWWGIPVHSYSWGGAYDLAYHELWHGARFLKYLWDAIPGDIASVNWHGTSFNNIDHTGVVTGTAGLWPTITQHTNNHRNYPIQNWYAVGPRVQVWIWEPVNG